MVLDRTYGRGITRDEVAEVLGGESSGSCVSAQSFVHYWRLLVGRGAKRGEREREGADNFPFELHVGAVHTAALRKGAIGFRRKHRFTSSAHENIRGANKGLET